MTTMKDAASLPQTRHLQLFDDEQLRAECERRGMICELHSVTHAVTMDERNIARRELKEWKAHHAAATKSLNEAINLRNAAESRAERAEARIGLNRSLKDAAYRSRNETHEELMRLIDILTPDQASALLEMYKNPLVCVPPTAPRVVITRDASWAKIPDALAVRISTRKGDPNSPGVEAAARVLSESAPWGLALIPKMSACNSFTDSKHRFNRVNSIGDHWVCNCGDVGPQTATALEQNQPSAVAALLPPRPIEEPLAHLDVDLLADDAN